MTFSSPKNHPTTGWIEDAMKRWSFLILVALTVLCLPGADGRAFRFGLGGRLSSFGLPNALLDLALYEHPQLAGTAVSFEIHSYGEKGPQSAFSGIYCLEYSHITGEGYWRVENYSNRVNGSGEVTQVNFTATILMHVFPSSPIHPYIGGGIGVGHMSIWAEGSYMDELGTTIRDIFEKKIIVPVGHIPFGVIANIGDKFLARAEVGFKNGFYFGGSVVVNL
jgi:hypothetical protein